jgi:hypothetical protein
MIWGLAALVLADCLSSKHTTAVLHPYKWALTAS